MATWSRDTYRFEFVSGDFLHISSLKHLLLILYHNCTGVGHNYTYIHPMHLSCHYPVYMLARNVNIYYIIADMFVYLKNVTYCVCRTSADEVVNARRDGCMHNHMSAMIRTAILLHQGSLTSDSTAFFAALRCWWRMRDVRGDGAIGR